MNDTERANQDTATGADIGSPSLIATMRAVEAARKQTMSRAERITFAIAFLEGVRMMAAKTEAESIRAHAEYRDLDVTCTECGSNSADSGLCDLCSLLAQDLSSETVGDYIDRREAAGEVVDPNELIQVEIGADVFKLEGDRIVPQDGDPLTYEQELQRQERVMAEHPERFPS